MNGSALKQCAIQREDANIARGKMKELVYFPPPPSQPDQNSHGCEVNTHLLLTDLTKPANETLLLLLL